MPDKSRLMILLVLVAWAAGGCIDAGVKDADVHRMRTAIEREVPQARVLQVQVGDPLEDCCGVDISVATDPASPADARRLSRNVAMAAWRSAPKAEIAIGLVNFVGGPDCRPPQTTRCWQDRLRFSWAEGAWMWAPEGDPAHKPPAEGSSGQSCEGGPDLEVPGFRLSGVFGFRPDLRATATAVNTVDAAGLQQAADGIAKFLWGCFPAPLESRTLTIQTGGATPGTRTFQFTADDLLERLGPRPAGLPR
jgi:hypothetical protein